MTTVGFGDLATPYLLQGQNAALQTRQQQLTTEITTGLAADTGARLRGSFSALAGVESSLGQLDAYANSSSLAALYTATQQSSLATLTSTATSLSTTLLQAGSLGGETALSTLSNQGEQALSGALSALNARAGNRSVFSGAATDQPAVAALGTIIAAVETAVAGQTTAADIAQAVRDWFTSPTGFAASGFLGSASPPSAVPIATGQTASVGTTALDPAIIGALTGFTLAALIDAPSLALSTAEQAGLATEAGNTLLSAGSSLTDLAGAIGTVQGQISSAQTRNAAESSSLQTARSRLLSVDQYRASTDLQLVQTQIETLYALTARISRLSLVNFLG